MNLTRVATSDLNNEYYHRDVSFKLAKVQPRGYVGIESIIESRGQLWYVTPEGMHVFSRIKLSVRYKDNFRGSFNYGFKCMIHDKLNTLPWGEAYEIR